MQRALKCDGVILEKWRDEGSAEMITPDDVREAKAYITETRRLSDPMDIVVNGNSIGMSESQQQDLLSQLKGAGATWWIEGLWESSPVAVTEIIQQGPPILE